MTITVSCPACNTSFPVDPAKIPPGGVRAQCSVCPEIFDVLEPDQFGAESAPDVSEADFSDPSPNLSEVDLSDPSPGLSEMDFSDASPGAELDEMAVPPDVESSLGADANVVSDIVTETSDEYGEREITFDSMTMDEDQGLAVDPGLEVETPEEDVGVIGRDAAPGPIQFGKRSPEDKARSLARSLVSDLIAYNPDKHKNALASGTLVQAFSEEIGKSWKEYREQVDPEVIAQGTFFNDALNEILADGASIFNVEG